VCLVIGRLLIGIPGHVARGKERAGRGGSRSGNSRAVLTTDCGAGGLLLLLLLLLVRMLVVVVLLQVQGRRGDCGASAVVQRRLDRSGGRELKVVGLQMIGQQIDGRFRGQAA